MKECTPGIGLAATSSTVQSIQADSGSTTDTFGDRGTQANTGLKISLSGDRETQVSSGSRPIISTDRTDGFLGRRNPPSVHVISALKDRRNQVREHQT